MSPPGRPKGSYRSAQCEGTPVSPPGAAQRTLALCADDFGASPGTSRAISMLVAATDARKSGSIAAVAGTKVLVAR